MTDNIAALFGEFKPGESLLELSYLTSGLSNDNYYLRAEGGEYLLKCYRGELPFEALTSQARFARGGLCPAPLWQDAERRVAIFEFHAGKQSAGYKRELIGHLARIHNNACQGLPMDVRCELSCYRDMQAYKPFCERVELALDYVAHGPFYGGYCHNDLVADNIIQTARGIVLIDFEYAGNNHVYFDLAAIALSYSMTHEQRQSLLEDYHAARGLQAVSEGDSALLENYRLLYGVLSYCWYVEHGARQQSEALKAQLMP